MTIHIRRYEDRDHEAVCSLQRLALATTGADAGDGPWDDDLKDIRGEYLDNHGEFLVADADGIIVGMGALRSVTADCGEIKRMRVDPTRQRNGIGTSILIKLEERAIALGYCALTLVTTEQQKYAQSFYSKHGYKEVSRQELAGFPCIFYEKELRLPPT